MEIRIESMSTSGLSNWDREKRPEWPELGDRESKICHLFDERVLGCDTCNLHYNPSSKRVWYRCLYMLYSRIEVLNCLCQGLLWQSGETCRLPLRIMFLNAQNKIYRMMKGTNYLKCSYQNIFYIWHIKGYFFIDTLNNEI